MTGKPADKPNDAEVAERMRGLARTIDTVINNDERPRRVGFVLLTFPLGPQTVPRPLHYIGSAQREEVIQLLREQLAKFDAGQSVRR